MIVTVLSISFLAACTPQNSTNTTENTDNPPLPAVVETTTSNTPPEVVANTANNLQYVDYSESKFNELKENKPFVLFFHASWCPTCRKLDSNINSSSEKLKGANILKIDYDTATELKKEYSVTVQHTLVFFNADGTINKTDKGTRISRVIDFYNNN